MIRGIFAVYLREMLILRISLLPCIAWKRPRIKHMEDKLKIALVHLNVRYKDVTTNCRRFIEMNRTAAQQDHKTIHTGKDIPGPGGFGHFAHTSLKER